MKSFRSLITMSLLSLTLLAAGCTSTGTLGLLTNSETETDLGPHD